jgi:hypothetical protein
MVVVNNLSLDDDSKSQLHSGDGANKIEKKINWSEENETILVEWCDIAQCYKWLYTRSHTKFASMHAWFTIPTIIFSTVSGTASFAQASLPQEYQNYATLAIGSINIFIGIFATVQQYLKISELNESHRVSAISWDKFARNIRIELAKTPDERTDAGHFIKVCRQEFDRLMETSPTIPDNIVNEFIDKFRGNTENEKEKFKNLKKPDICDTITTVNETRHKWYLDERKKKAEEDEQVELENNGRQRSFESISTNGDISNEFSNLMLTRLKDIRRKKSNGIGLENILKTQEQIDKELLSDKKMIENDKKTAEKNKHMERIHTYIETFYGIYQRRPLKEEIQETLKAEVDEETLTEFLITYDSTVFAL